LGAVPAAGKTGTTDHATAVWFVGYTDTLAAAVWAGNPDASTPLRNITVGDTRLDEATGGKLPGPIWATAMAAALGLPADPAQRQAAADQRLPQATPTDEPSPAAKPSSDPAPDRVPSADELSDWGIQYDQGWAGDQPDWRRADYGKKHHHGHHRESFNCPDPDADDAYDCD
jgi:membrane peptidoglycan carboxypeptidase